MKYEELKKSQAPRCLNCGEVVYGRPDKKFCSGLCKDKFHNASRKREKTERDKTIAALDKNYQVLRFILQTGKTVMALEKAVNMGFDPGYCSSYTTRNRHGIYRIYDIEYILTSQRLYGIRLMSSTADPSFQQKAPPYVSSK